MTTNCGWRTNLTSIPTAIRWAIAGKILVLVTLVGSASLLAYQGYEVQRERALTQVENLSRLLERNLDSILEPVDVTLRSVAREAEQELRRGSLDGKYLNDLLAYQRSFMPHLLSLRMMDASGTVRFGNDLTDARVNLAERSFFRQLQSGGPNSGTVMDGPVFAKISKQWVIVLARRINRPDGSFAGVVYANIATDHLSKIFSEMNLGDHGAVSLRTSDLRLVARFPHPEEGANIIGTSNVSSQLKDALAASPLAGTYVAKTSIDGIERANAYRQLAGFPLIVLVGLGTEDYLNRWRQDAATIFSLSALVVMLTLLSCWVFYRAWITQKIQKSLIEGKEERLRLALSAACMEVFELDTVKRTSINETDGIIGRGLPREFTVDDYIARVHPDDRPGLQDALGKLTPAQPMYRHPYRFRMPDGSYRWLMDQGLAGFDGNGQPIRILGVCWDISAQKRAEETILAQNEELERRVEERTAALIAINQELEGFTYAASHDLKGPLGRIIAFSEMLQRNSRNCLARPERTCLRFTEFIRQNAARLNDLVDDLLNNAMAAKQDLVLQPVDVNALVLACIDEQKDTIQGRRTEVAIELPPVSVLADSKLLHQVFRNLLENAIKYSTGTSAPRIEIGAEILENCCRFWIRDNGIGFDMRYREQIFEIFRRLHTYNEIPGSGVGLALVKRAVERMEGRVWAESEPSQGATFFLELEIAPANSLAFTAIPSS